MLRPFERLPVERAVADLHLLKALLKYLDLSKPNLDLIAVDYNINDPEVALLSAKILDSVIRGTWRKGYVPEVPELEPSRVVRDPERIGELLRERLG